jgi:hypothetical protein
VITGTDLLEADGEDPRSLPFEKRKAKLVRLLARTNVGIALDEHTEADGATVSGRPAQWASRASSRRRSAPYWFRTVPRLYIRECFGTFVVFTT